VVPAPEIRRATVVDDRFVRLEWDEMQKNRQPLDFFEIEKQDAAAAYRWLFSAPAADTFVFHDHQTKVDDASYVYHLRAVDVCGDKSAFSNIGKSILLQTDINMQYRPELHWTKYQEWKEGVKEYVIEKRNGSGEFTEVARTATADDTFYVDNLSSLNCIPLFEYRVYAIRNTPVGLPAGVGEIRSYSNVDAPPVVTKVFIPNAFTPDANGLNEVFKPQGIYVASYTMKIYNRWGEKVYEGSECENSWDGMYNGAQAPHGVYIYTVDAKGSDGRRYHFRGDVTLLR
jgi:gliding motility-associated-like protein